MMSKHSPLVLILITVSNMAGGFFILPASLAPLGWLGLFGWLGAFLGALSLAMVFSVIAQRNAGIGMLPYIGKILGRRTEFVATCSYWLTCLVGNSAFIIVIVASLSHYFPILNDGLWAYLLSLVMIWIVLGLIVVNLRIAFGVQAFFAVLFVMILLAVIVVGFVLGHHAPSYHTVVDRSTFAIVLQASMLCFWCFMGIETGSILANRVHNPSRNVTIIVLSSVVITAVLCASTTAMLFYTLPQSVVAQSNAPLITFFTLYLGANMANVLGLVMSVIMLVSLVGWLMLQSEPLSYGASRGLFPQWLARGRGNAPVASLVLGAIAMSVVLLIQVSQTLLIQFEVLESWTVLNTLIPFFLVAWALYYTSQCEAHFISKGSALVAMMLVIILALAIPLSAWLYGVIFLVLSFGLKKSEIL